ncbi:MAG: nucleoside recognition protein [Lachnospiraceae bacterium]|nr:nucleoside recognition protein [Agathobacter sp.]MDD6291998.1 nucleoside recognition protein [Lachnospiraceae bacterium]
MNYLWGGMIVIGVVYGALTGNLGAVTDQALASAKEAISLCITMAGAMAFWVGIMRIAERAGMIERIAHRMNPLLQFLFPSVPRDSDARTHIATNMVANMLGLGWAATPAGLSAMKELKKLDARSGRATDAMCDFLILNISSLQLIPVNIIAYRGEYGSVRPAAIVGPAMIATLVSTGAAVIFIKLRQFVAHGN